MGGAVKRAFSNPVRGVQAVSTFGTSEYWRNHGGPLSKGLNALPTRITDMVAGTHYGDNGESPDVGAGDQFHLDPAQLAADRQAIEQEGSNQLTRSNAFIDSESANRADARAKLAAALSKDAQGNFEQNVPQMLEDLNSRKLLNSSALGEKLALEQGNLQRDIATKMGVAGAQDIDWASSARNDAEKNYQGYTGSSLQRQLSLEDFINQANVAKSIGAQMAPQVGNGKGSMISGAGAGASAGSAFGPWGALIGGVGGAALGTPEAKKGK
jgi:hypothetical protein